MRLPNGLLSSGLPVKTLYAPLLSHMRATYAAHLSPFGFITRMMCIKLLVMQSSSLSYVPVVVCLSGDFVHAKCSEV